MNFALCVKTVSHNLPLADSKPLTTKPASVSGPRKTVTVKFKELAVMACQAKHVSVSRPLMLFLWS